MENIFGSGSFAGTLKEPKVCAILDGSHVRKLWLVDCILAVISQAETCHSLPVKNVVNNQAGPRMSLQLTQRLTVIMNLSELYWYFAFCSKNRRWRGSSYSLMASHCMNFSLQQS